MTLKELELAIVRVAEKWPDRIGPYGFIGDCDSHCLLGQVLHDAGLCREINSILTHIPGANQRGTFSRRVSILNDRRLPWGQIPIKLGLVPGEQPVRQQEPVVELEEVSV